MNINIEKLSSRTKFLRPISTFTNCLRFSHTLVNTAVKSLLQNESTKDTFSMFILGKKLDKSSWTLVEISYHYCVTYLGRKNFFCRKKGRKRSDDYKTFCLQLQSSTVSLLQQGPPRQLQSETGFQNKLNAGLKSGRLPSTCAQCWTWSTGCSSARRASPERLLALLATVHPGQFWSWSSFAVQMIHTVDGEGEDSSCMIILKWWTFRGTCEVGEKKMTTSTKGADIQWSTRRFLLECFSIISGPKNMHWETIKTPFSLTGWLLLGDHFCRSLTKVKFFTDQVRLH